MTMTRTASCWGLLFRILSPSGNFKFGFPGLSAMQWQEVWLAGCEGFVGVLFFLLGMSVVKMERSFKASMTLDASSEE